MRQKKFLIVLIIKNMNSFRFIERAIAFEISRQAEILESGGTVRQETRQYDADKDLTRSMRSKEEAHDYRYFPDPDLLPLELKEEFIESVRKTLPELPWEKHERFKTEYALNDYDANFLTSQRDTAHYFEAAVKASGAASPKMVANWVAGDVMAALHQTEWRLSECPVPPEALGELLTRIADQTLSNTMAKQVFEAMWKGEGSADAIIEKKGLKQITDTGEIEPIIDEIIANNPQQLAQYHAGKDKLFGYFVGQVMAKTKGKANPQQVNALLKKKLTK